MHALGLRFQLRMERGIPIEAVQQKVPILGTNFTVDEIADLTLSCGKFGVTGGWGGSFAGINVSHPGALAYVRSIVDLWIEWGVDAIEADDYFGGQPSLPAGHPQTHGIVPTAESIRTSPKSSSWQQRFGRAKSPRWSSV